MIGSLLYLTASRPDILFSVCLCARFQSDPNETHLTVVKRIFRYLKGTTNLGLLYKKSSDYKLVGFCDAESQSKRGFCEVLALEGIYRGVFKILILFAEEIPLKTDLD